MDFSIDERLKAGFDGLRVLVREAENLNVTKENPELESFKKEVIERTRKRYAIETLKDEKILSAYRSFFWKLDIDPTKTRPAAEALIRRIIAGKPLPKINTLVDSYNLSSIDSMVSLAVFDKSLLSGNLEMRFGESGEKFVGVGMKEPMELKGNEIVIADEKELIAIYPYRDADRSKITKSTKNAVIIVCGVPGIEMSELENASKIASEYITRFCGGTII
jgi:DNA/RNA-binding domain of Phe-tRNA-synthetase-like protein